MTTGSAAGPEIRSALSGYTLANVGGQSTTVSLTKQGQFFSQTPASFSLAAGASQTLEIRGQSQPVGTYEGASIPQGNGVPSGLTIPIS